MNLSLFKTPLSAAPAALLLLLAAAPARAQFTYPGCDTVQASDFRVDTLVRGPSADDLTKEPMKMAFDRDSAGNVDVYFTQRYGMLRRYNGATRTTTTLANFAFTAGASLTDTTRLCISCVSTGPSLFNSSEGLLGVALDPGFKANRWVYLYLAVKGTTRVTRYTLVGDALSLSSAKDILRFANPAISQHMGGTIRFDGEGNLWVSLADGGSTEKSTAPYQPDLRYQAANTNALFGKILRIRPIAFADDQNPAPGVGTTYTIPAGNLFPVGTAKARPEIYVMGNRNPYTINIDTVRKAVVWGEVGPNGFAVRSGVASQAAEEFNLASTPGYYGWPYWVGNYNGAVTDPEAVLSEGSTREAPINDRPDNTGLVNLPPARPALVAYGRSMAITGPVYYYDPNLVSGVKFPPHFHGAWFVGDFESSWIDALQLDAPGTQVLGRKKMFVATSAVGGTAGYLMQLPVLPSTESLLEMQMGPDGALYVLNYAGYRSTSAKSGIVRIAYTGACRPSTVPVAFTSRFRPSVVEMSGTRVRIAGAGAHRLELRDPAGRVLWRREGRGPAEYDLREARSPGLRLLSVTGAGERFARRVMLP